MTHPTMPTGTPNGPWHPKTWAANTLPYPENPDGPRWGPPVIVNPPRPGITDRTPCGWCGQVVGPNRVVSAGIAYCTEDHADLGVHRCGHCDGDIRIKSQAGPLPACNHKGHWHPPASTSPTFRPLVEPAPIEDPAAASALATAYRRPIGRRVA